MTLTLDLPKELAEVLSSRPEREVLEAVALSLVVRGRITVGRAGEILGMDRLEAVRWYTGHGLTYPNLSEDDVNEEVSYAG